MAFTLNQHLIPLDVSADINESLEAPVADPLWTLSRQLLMGEFEAEAGGRPVQLESTWTVSPISRARIGEQTVDLEPGRPMESVVEAESNASTSPAWNSEDLEYQFSVEAGNDQLNARDYEGRDLDWYHFERTEAPEPAPGEVTELVQRSIPRRLTLRGLPHPSFWRFEEGGVAFVPERDPMPNALSVLLPEFAFLDANDWFVVPLEGVAGAVQRVKSVRMVDSFGHVTDLAAGIGRQPGDVWRVFTIDHATDGSPTAPFCSARTWPPTRSRARSWRKCCSCATKPPTRSGPWNSRTRIRQQDYGSTGATKRPAVLHRHPPRR